MEPEEDEYASYADEWDSYTGEYTVQVAECMKEHVTKDMEVLELGSGTGALAYLLAPSVRSYIAVDGSPAMLNKSREKTCDDARFGTMLKMVNSANDLLDMMKRKVDVAFSVDTIHSVSSDKQRILVESMARVAADEGSVILIEMARIEGDNHHDHEHGSHPPHLKVEDVVNLLKSVGLNEISVFRDIAFVEKHPLFMVIGRK